MSVDNSITYGEVEEFFNNLMSPNTPRMRKYHVYGTYIKAIRDEQKTNDFEKAATGKSDAWRYFGTMIGEDMCVVSTTHRNGKEFYFSCYKDEQGKIRVNCDAFTTFDDAVLGCVVFKRTNSVDSIYWINKLLAKDEEEADN